MRLRQVVLALATMGGVGYLPGMPGTWGSLAALPLWWGLSHLDWRGYLAVLVALLAVSVWVTGRAQDYLGPDNPAIVLDEVVGLFIALAGVPRAWPWVLAGFVLFRLLDIWKPFPVEYGEKFPGGWGVVLDDAAAGLLARAGVAIIIGIWGRG